MAEAEYFGRSRNTKLLRVVSIQDLRYEQKTEIKAGKMRALWCDSKLWHTISRGIAGSVATVKIGFRSMNRVSSVVALMAECHEP